MRVDKIYPLLVSTLITCVFGYLIYLNKVNLRNIDKLIDVSINIAGILLGFLITLHGILISMRGSRVMKVLKESNSLKDLNDYLKSSIIASANVLGYCLLILIFDFKTLLPSEYTQEVIFLFWVLLIFYLALCSYRFISLFIAIVAEEDKPRPS
jgi:hypothetical protein